MSSIKQLNEEEEKKALNFSADADNETLTTDSPDGEEEDEGEMLRRAIAMSLEEQ